MKNADKPINSPLFIVGDISNTQDLAESLKDIKIAGLTKREYFAGIALQGLCSSEQRQNNSPSFIVEIAVKLADKLLEQLEKPTDENN